MNRRRQRLSQAKLLAADTKYIAFATYLAASTLLIIGLGALVSILLRLSRVDG